MTAPLAFRAARPLTRAALDARDLAGGHRTGWCTIPVTDADLDRYVTSILVLDPSANCGEELLVVRWCRRVKVSSARWGRAWQRCAGLEAWRRNQASS